MIYLTFGQKILVLISVFALTEYITANEYDNLVFDRFTKSGAVQGRADIVFLLDRSGSVGVANFEIQKGFVESLLMHVVVDANATRVAIISYSTTPKLHINYLRNPKSKCSLSQELQDVIYENSEATDIAAALEKARMVFSDARPDVNKVVILISDGISTHGVDPVPVATRLKSETGVEIFSIGIGRFLKSQMEAMASSPNHILTCSGYNEFKSLARKIRGDPHESKWSNEVSTKENCDHLCNSPYRDKPGGPGCCDYHASCSCALLSGIHTCICQPGYYGLSGFMGNCRDCPRGTYKSNLEPSLSCTSCPLHSTTVRHASTSIKDCICEDGYKGSPSDGIPCVAVTCPPLQNPTNGVLLRGCNNVFPSICYFMCNEGYELADPNTDTLICESNGQWSESLPVCRRISCGAPLHSEYSRVRCEKQELSVGTSCTFSCFTGFILKGSQVRKCLPNKLWSGVETECVVVQCPIPKPLHHGTIINCGRDKKPSYGEACIFTCNEGYKLTGPEAVVCNEHGILMDIWTLKEYAINPPKCEDIQSPKIICPKSKRVYAVPEKAFAIVHWENPRAFDNSGTVPKLRSIPPGVQSPAKFPIAKTTIWYEAIDPSGLKANCSFTIEVIDNEKPRVLSCPSSLTISTSHNHAEVFWNEPLFKDNSFAKISIRQSHKPGDVFTIGRHTVAYIATDTSGNQAECLFYVTITQNSCPYYPPPLNGALVCEDWMFGQFCQTYCNDRYDFVTKPAEWYMCSDEATWVTLPPHYALPWPDCTKKAIPMGVRQMLSGFYYSGNCNEPKTQKAIKQAFLKHFVSKFNAWEYCFNAGACTIEMVNVTCGATWDNKYRMPRNKRDLWEQAEKKELEIEFDIYIDPHTKFPVSEEKFYDEFLQSLESFDWNVDEELMEQFSSIQPDSTSDQSQGSVVFETKETRVLCQPGSVLKEQECMLCPRGSYHNTVMNRCQDCPIGYYQENEGQLACVACPPGTSTEGIHSNNQSECKGICTEGTYSVTGLETCISCPIGTFQSKQKQIHCVPCPNDSSTAMEGAKSSDACQRPCAPGFYSESGLEVCMPCAQGYYQPQSMQTDCIKCPLKLTTFSIASVSIKDCVSYNPCHNASICMHGGTCVADDQGLSCHCPNGYSGAYCEDDIDECSANPCADRGECINLDGSFYCNCTRGFHGETCNEEINECESSPCLNNGTCLDQYDGYMCICSPAYGGNNCEEPLNVCFENIICQNGGKCGITEVGTEESCICPEGFTGLDCSINIDDCLNVTCHNDARCIDQVGGYYCNCSMGFTGTFCEEEINECLDNDCFEGSTCLDGVGSYKCICPIGWSGRLCDHKMNSDFILHYPEESSLANMATVRLDSPLSEVTVSMWIQNNDVSGKSSALLSYAAYENAIEDHARSSNNGLKVLDNALTITDCSSLTVYVNNEPVDIGVQVSDGSWHHIAFRWSSSNDGEWNLFKDCELVSSGSNLQNNKLIPPGGHLVVGQEQDTVGGGFSPVESFSGNISRLNIWNTCFSSTKINRLCNLDDDIPGKVVAWADFREKTSGNVQLLPNEKPFLSS